jgi:sulfite exporter TauE/SafE
MVAWPLVLAGLALGVAATPHCAVMCGAPCAALTQGCARSTGGFHAGRLIGYTAAGALAASSVAALGAWSQAAPALRPLWTLLHLAFLGLGLWWMLTGRQPAWMRRSGAVPVRVVGRRAHALRASLAGLAWVAWPCAALQGALLLAALGSDALDGALVMAAFVLGSTPGLAAAPWAWARWQARRGLSAAAPAQVAALGFRIAGGALAVASGWALTQGIWARFAAWCLA